MTSGKPSKTHSSASNNEKKSNLIATDSNEAYRRGVKLLHEKCKALQRSNERLVFRLHRVQKMTRLRAMDVEILKAKLDYYGDGWRTAVDPADVKEEGEE
ncbi:TCF3 fusion partner homolog [Anopheles stephensi]|uniref:INO80 complex subunit F domain-containing protein n=1 Tax=Anopheles stephensi TaxID=30069 RepID=A0A182Y6Z4_ANOST|nr:TCF3 fusion partner homolog [Anopheles stephensi]